MKNKRPLMGIEELDKYNILSTRKIKKHLMFISIIKDTKILHYDVIDFIDKHCKIAEYLLESGKTKGFALHLEKYLLLITIFNVGRRVNYVFKVGKMGILEYLETNTTDYEFAFMLDRRLDPFIYKVDDLKIGDVYTDTGLNDTFIPFLYLDMVNITTHKILILDGLSLKPIIVTSKEILSKGPLRKTLDISTFNKAICYNALGIHFDIITNLKIIKGV